MSIFPRPLKKVLDKIIPFSQEDKVPTFNLGSGTADNTTFLRGDGTWSTPGSSGYVPYIGATADVDLGTYKITADAVEFSLTPVNAPAAGQIAYDGTSGSLAYLLNSSNVLSRIGQTMHAYVHNEEAVTITKGQAVYLYKAVGNKASVKLAYNTTDATSAKTFGLAAEDIGAGQNGMVICQGVLEGLNTGSYTAGDTLYLGATAGTYTATKPYAPNHLVYIGIVERANAGNGQIYVKTQNGYELDEIHDVDLITTPPVAGNVLTYNGSLWNAQAPSGGVTSVTGTSPISSSGGSTPAISIQDAAADGTTKGAATFNANDFNAVSGVIAIDYTNGKAASTTDKGFLTSTDWNTFNGKQDTLVSGTNIKTINGNSVLGSGNLVVGSGLTIGTTAITSGTVGRILFEDTGNVVQEDSALFWDNTNKRLGVGATPATTVRLDVRAHGALSTDIAFRVRNSGDTVNSVEYNGDGSKYWRAHSGDMHLMFDTANNRIHLKRTGTYLIQTDNAVTELQMICNNGNLQLRGGSKQLHVYNGGNFHLGGTALLAGSGDGNLIFQNGTAPSTNLIDRHYYYSADIVAGNAAPHFRTENGSIIKLYQETTGVTAATVAGSGGTSITTNSTFDGYTIAKVVKALRNLGILQ